MSRPGKMIAAFLGLLLFIFVAAVLVSRSTDRGKTRGQEMLTESEAALRYPYQTLNTREKALYTALYRGMLSCRTEIALPESYSDAEYRRIYLLVTMQEPELFYLSDVYELRGEIDSVRIHYDMSPEQIGGQRGRLEAAADRILSRISPVQSDWQKLLMIHDAVAAGCMYEESGSSDNALGCLADGLAVCEGYAKAFLYTARRAGLNAMCVSGTSARGELHVWNIAEIGGKYYNIDVTWDDQTDELTAVHSCFAVPDRNFTDHSADLTAFQPPECTEMLESYYWKRGLVLSEKAQLTARLTEWGAQYAAEGLLEFQCSSDALFQEVKAVLQADPMMQITLSQAVGGRGMRLMYDDRRQVVIVVTR